MDTKEGKNNWKWWHGHRWFSSGSRNLSGGGADDLRNLRPVATAIFFLTSFNRGRGARATAPLDPLLWLGPTKIAAPEYQDYFARQMLSIWFASGSERMKSLVWSFGCWSHILILKILKFDFPEFQNTTKSFGYNFATKSMNFEIR